MNNINNNKVFDEINEIEKKIDDLIQTDDFDKKKLVKLRMQQLMAGLPLNNGIKKGKIY